MEFRSFEIKKNIYHNRFLNKCFIFLQYYEEGKFRYKKMD